MGGGCAKEEIWLDFGLGFHPRLKIYPGGQLSRRLPGRKSWKSETEEGEISLTGKLFMLGLLPFVLIACQSLPDGYEKASVNTDGKWQGLIPCSPSHELPTRFPKVEVTGDRATLTNFGTYGETHTTQIKNGKASFLGSYKKTKGTRTFSATVQQLTSGEVYVGGWRGPKNCRGVIPAIQPIAINQLGVKYEPEKVQPCVAVGGSNFIPTRENLLRYSKLRNLKDVTIVSQDKYGVFVLYLDDTKNALGFMLDLKVSDAGNGRKKTEDWSVGKVTIKNNQYCRTWKQWRSGHEENCWQVHQDESERLYFVCPDTLTHDGEKHFVIKGNAYNATLKGGGERCSDISWEENLSNPACYVEFDDKKIGAFGF